MAQEKLQRKEFLKNLLGQKTATAVEDGPGDPDPLFDKYSRKSLGNRQYSERVAIPVE